MSDKLTRDYHGSRTKFTDFVLKWHVTCPFVAELANLVFGEVYRGERFFTPAYRRGLVFSGVLTETWSYETNVTNGSGTWGYGTCFFCVFLLTKPLWNQVQKLHSFVLKWHVICPLIVELEDLSFPPMKSPRNHSRAKPKKPSLSYSNGK